MTTLHMDTETVFATAQSLQRSGESIEAQLQSLRTALRSLESAWQGGGSEDFDADALSVLKRLDAEGLFLTTLARRVQAEVQEWELADQSVVGREGAASLLPWLNQGGYLPIVGGGLTFASILPMMAAFRIDDLMPYLPQWLKDLLNRLFPPTGPVVLPKQETHPPAVTFGDLLEKAQQATPSASLIHDVPVKSQGTLYGSAACSLASISMVLDYFHAKDEKNQVATPEELEKMLDPGDGTWGKGIGLNKITDDLNELGYNNISVHSGASLDDLKSKLENGPVIITGGVKLIGPPRALDSAGNTIHAMVIKGIVEGQVVINDPWTGAEIRLPMDTFLDMWKRGQNGMYVIQP